jgi:diguanylate cyclase (GGDEF)-like protein
MAARAAQQAVANANRHKYALSLLFLDLDHFKRINDNHGHDAGDNVLRELGALLRKSCRDGDIAARFGGEEFVVLLVNAGEASAIGFAMRVREQLRQVPMPPLTQPITASYGVAELREGEGWDALLKRADDALYEAKDSGRDRVCVAKVSPPAPGNADTR